MITSASKRPIFQKSTELASSLWFVTARPLFFAALSFLYFWNAATSLADQYDGVGAGSGTLAHRARASLRPASEVRTKKTEREREGEGERERVRVRGF